MSKLRFANPVGANLPRPTRFPKRAGVGSPVNSRNLQPRLRHLPTAAAGGPAQSPFSAVDGRPSRPVGVRCGSSYGRAVRAFIGGDLAAGLDMCVRDGTAEAVPI